MSSDEDEPSDADCISTQSNLPSLSENQQDSSKYINFTVNFALFAPKQDGIRNRRRVYFAQLQNKVTFSHIL